MSSLKETMDDIAHRSVGPALAYNSEGRQAYVQGIDYRMWLIGQCISTVNLMDPDYSYERVAEQAIDQATMVIKKLAEIEIKESQSESD